MTTSTLDPTDRNDAIALIRLALRKRSGKAWSVKGGTGSAWGWIYVNVPPAQQNRFGGMAESARIELGELLGQEVHHQGVRIPASAAYRREYVARANGETPAELAVPYWD